MRISILLNNPIARTGGSLTLYHFMDELTKRGHEVYAISPFHREKWAVGQWQERVDDNTAGRKVSFYRNNIERIVLPRWRALKKKLKKQSRTDFIAESYVEDMIRRTKCLMENWIESDVTIAVKNTTALAAYCLADRTVPLYHIMHFEEIMYPTDHLVARLYARLTYQLPLLIVPNSAWLQNILRKIFDRATPVLNHAIDHDVFHPLEDIRTKYRDKKSWLIVSYFDEKRKWKGFDDAVAAVKLARERLAKKGYRIAWKVYGANPPRRQYATDFEYVGRVSTEELVRLYSSADIVLMASWYESFPLPPLEAMACGTLAITSRYGTEDYALDGQTALVFLPKKVDDIADRLVYAIEHPAECAQLTESGLEMSRKFTWERATDKLESIISTARKSYSYKPFKFFEDLNRGQFEEYMHDVFSTEAEADEFLFKRDLADK